MLSGEYDHLPEAALYETIEEAVEKAEKMAKDVVMSEEFKVEIVNPEKSFYQKKM